MHFKMSSGKWRPFCLGLNVLSYFSTYIIKCFCKHTGLCSLICCSKFGFPGKQKWYMETYQHGLTTKNRPINLSVPTKKGTAMTRFLMWLRYVWHKMIQSSLIVQLHPHPVAAIQVQICRNNPSPRMYDPYKTAYVVETARVVLEHVYK